VFKEDSGNYVVKASNSAGSARCFASLTVKTGGEKHMVKTRLVESSHSTLKTVAAGHTPPEFTRLFRDTRVRPGEPCTLEVAITGTPRPMVSPLHLKHLSRVFLFFLAIYFINAVMCY